MTSRRMVLSIFSVEGAMSLAASTGERGGVQCLPFSDGENDQVKPAERSSMTYMR